MHQFGYPSSRTKSIGVDCPWLVTFLPPISIGGRVSREYKRLEHGRCRELRVQDDTADESKSTQVHDAEPWRWIVLEKVSQAFSPLLDKLWLESRCKHSSVSAYRYNAYRRCQGSHQGLVMIITTYRLRFSAEALAWRLRNRERFERDFAAACRIPSI